MIQGVDKILKDTNTILQHQKELSRLQGENFNIFSILNMESKENATHSAFLGELLNPKGSHEMGSVFLKCFLEILELEEHIDLDSAQVKLEYFIGKRDQSEILGGRIDIFIFDNNYKTICIENKIYAGDQDLQIARYQNYNTANNKVYYLTLEGDEAPKSSRGKLKLNNEYFTLSYAMDITEWLSKCVKEAANFPILRETIKQYNILIKKLTNQLTDSAMEKDIQGLIIQNYEAAKTISSSIGKIELSFAEEFVKAVADQLKSDLTESWSITVSEDLKKAWTGISVTHARWPKKVKIKLEGASKIPWNNSIYGVHAPQKDYDREKITTSLSKVELLKSGFKNSNTWPVYRKILNFGNLDERAKLFKEQSRKDLIKIVSAKMKEICELCEGPFSVMNKQS